MSEPLTTSVVIPNKDGADIVGRCVRAALASGATEVLVVDDGSTDASAAEAESAGATVLTSPGRGFAAAVNAGASRSTGDVILVLNSDCFLEPDALGKLARTVTDEPGLGLCGAALVEKDGGPGKTCGRAVTLMLALQTVLSVNAFDPPSGGEGVEIVEFVPLACAAFRRATFENCGGLDERFPFYFEDQDVCRRLRQRGFQIAVNWDAIAVHVGGASSLARDPQRWFVQYTRSRALYLRKHYRLTWPVFSVVWLPTALVHAGVWSTRPGTESKRWMRAWLTASHAGIRG